ncbi:hypothetical protein SYN60AY4M2_00420 [Synechococcus sp. 60AY4M2]|nr:hypothetical protein SYN60AY4M2_00420 [Synechococcus sp. 60AY4M2]PIK99171.1 hypothetical protein SYN63AY4M1_11360 [Synechococcus sp. 63AY4M1]
MHDFNITPFSVQIFSNQPTMTVLRSSFTTKQTSSIENTFIHLIFDTTLGHQRQKLSLIIRPVTTSFISIKNFLGRCQFWQMNVSKLTDLVKEEL